MHRIGIVEDDPLSVDLIKEYLSRYGKEHNEEFRIDVFTDGNQIVSTYRPIYDILFLDIQMEKMDGIETARHIREVDGSTIIIFITSTPQYAINGYQVGALSYLLKPLPWFAFSQEMDRSMQMLKTKLETTVLFDVGSSKYRLAMKDILYIESIKHNIIVHIANGETLQINSSLKVLEELLEPHGFFRSNSCYLVNMDHVIALEGQDSVMSNNEKLRVSRPRKNAFMAALTDYIAGIGMNTVTQAELKAAAQIIVPPAKK